MFSSSNEEAKLEKSLSKNKINIMSDSNTTFVVSILLNLVFKWDRNIPIAATDGLTLFFNPDVYNELDNNDHRIFIILHEVWHVAFMHPARLNGRDPRLFNIAADHVINLMLKDLGYKMPTGKYQGVADPRFIGLSAEQVYEILKDEQEQSGEEPEPDFTMDVMAAGSGTPDESQEESQDEGDKESDDKGSSCSSDQEPSNTSPMMSEEEATNQMRQLIAQATVRTQMSGDTPGSIPGSILIEMEKLFNPKLNWYDILINYCDSISKNDYSYRRPNRRFMPDHYLPSAYSEGLDKIAFAVDTSGSVSDDQFTHFISEMNEVKERLLPQHMTVVDFDYQIRDIHELGPDDDIRSVEFSGRGGTYLQPVFDHFNTRGNEPNVLIVFSDLHCDVIENKPSYPVIWIVVDNLNAETNFGKMIHYSTED